MKLKTLLEKAGLGKKVTSKDFAIEIEVEGKHLPNIRSKYWEAVGDGSLRNGVEYRSNGPQSLADWELAIDELENEFKAVGSKLDFSFRTSTHIHMNMTQDELGTIQTITYIYLLFEDAFLKYAGEAREGNRFCLGFKDAEGVVNDVLTMLNPANVLLVHGDMSRYASINIAALAAHGTLEFRALRGTMDEDVLRPWIETLFRIRDVARVLKSPDRAYKMLMDQGIEKFSKYIFKKHFESFYYPDFYADLDYNTSCLIQLPFSLTDQEEPVEKKVKKKAKIDKVMFDELGIDPVVAE